LLVLISGSFQGLIVQWIGCRSKFLSSTQIAKVTKTVVHTHHPPSCEKLLRAALALSLSKGAACCVNNGNFPSSGVNR
jgi:hypothetical protein